MAQITIHNKRVCAFYQTNPFISFEEVNIFMVDLLEEMLQNSESCPDKSLAAKLSEQMAKSQTEATQSHQNIHTLLLRRPSRIKTYTPYF